MRNTIIPIRIIAGLLLAVFSIVACGIKGPPVPPDRGVHAPAAVLDFRLADDRVTLTWHLPERLDASLMGTASFDIYRSRATVTEPVCDTCPLVFEKVASVPYRHTDDDRLSASLALDAGYRYAYKVRLDARGVDGTDSNTVRFAFSPDR